MLHVWHDGVKFATVNQHQRKLVKVYWTAWVTYPKHRPVVSWVTVKHLFRLLVDTPFHSNSSSERYFCQNKILAPQNSHRDVGYCPEIRARAHSLMSRLTCIWILGITTLCSPTGSDSKAHICKPGWDPTMSLRSRESGDPKKCQMPEERLVSRLQALQKACSRPSSGLKS